MKLKFAPALVLTASLLYPAAAHASLSTFQTYVGNYGVSTDGFGSLAQTGTISAEVPAGATVVAAFLYSSNFGGAIAPGRHVGRNPRWPMAPAVPNPDVCCGLSSNRADVTAIVAPIIDGGPGGVYDFTVTETDGSQDGTALVVVYSLASLPVSTVGILDGFSSAAETAHRSTSPIRWIRRRLGSSRKCASPAASAAAARTPTITVNGTIITENAGNHDDGLASSRTAACSPWAVSTTRSPRLLPSYDQDHERYNLIPRS